MVSSLGTSRFSKEAISVGFKGGAKGEPYESMSGLEVGDPYKGCGVVGVYGEVITKFFLVSWSYHGLCVVGGVEV